MNERNVKALEEMIGRHFPLASGVHPDHVKIVARVLAAQGVLVPSVLTHEDIGEILASVDEGDRHLPDALERIAKGEA